MPGARPSVASYIRAMPTPGNLALTAVLAYLLGGMDAAYYVVRAITGCDVRDIGSGSAGARNAGRLLGAGGFALVFALDCAKGAAAVWAASTAGTGPVGMTVAAIAVVIGHIAPAQLRFRGGKGASPTMGALLVLVPLVAIAAFLTSVAMYAVTRQATRSGVAAFFLLPAYAVVTGADRIAIAGVMVITLLLLYTHRSHVRSLLTFRRTLTDTGEAPR